MEYSMNKKLPWNSPALELLCLDAAEQVLYASDEGGGNPGGTTGGGGGGLPNWNGEEIELPKVPLN